MVKKIRCYDLTNSSLQECELQFKWYVNERECNVALTSDSNGTIKIAGNKPSDEDLEKNTDVKIKLDSKELSLVGAIEKLEPQSEPNKSRVAGVAPQQRRYSI